MQKKLLLVVLSAFLIVSATGCVKTPKLENGQEVIAEMDGKQYTANDLYSDLKEKYGTNALVEMIDNYIISKELDNTSDEEVKAKSYINQMKEYYAKQGQKWEDVLSQYGYTEEQLIKEYTANYAKDTAARKYYKSLVTDEQIKKYYDSDIIGDITAKHILINVKTDEKASDEDKKKADTEAYNKALEVIKKLNDGGNFADLAKEYSDDQSASEGGNLAPFNKQSNYEKEFINAAVALNPGEYSKKPVKTQYGYHIIYVESKKDKPSLDDVKDTIITSISDKAISENKDYLNTAWKKLREKYNLTIYDTVINEKYATTVSQYK